MAQHERQPTGFAAYLQGIIDERGISARRVSAYADVSPNTVNLWLRGVSTPTPALLVKLSEALRIPHEDLMRAAGHLPGSVTVRPQGIEPTGGVGTPSVSMGDPHEAIRRLAEHAITVVPRRIRIQESWVHAGGDAVEAEFVYEMPQWMGKRVVAFRVRGSCMQPIVAPGDVVIAHLDGAAQDGKLVVADVDGRPEVRLYDAKHHELAATDGSPPIPFNGARVVVPVLGIWKEMVDLEESE